MVLVDPIQLTPSGEALPEDRALYARSLADGMESILKKKIDPEDRFRIAEEMKSLNWSRLVNPWPGFTIDCWAKRCQTKRYGKPDQVSGLDCLPAAVQ